MAGSESHRPIAEPLLGAADVGADAAYVPRGEEVSIEHPEGGRPLRGYCARPSTGDCSQAVLMFHDGLGFPSGRCREICDRLAADGFLVLLPDLFGEDVLAKNFPEFEPMTCGLVVRFLCVMLCGGAKKFLQKNSWDRKVRRLVFDVALPWMEAQGARHFASVGFSWGTYCNFKCASEKATPFDCGVNFHMSVDAVCRALKESDLELCERVRCPQLLVACRGDGPAYHPGGAAAETVLRAAPGSVVLETDMKHGFMNRANTVDASDPRVDQKLEAFQSFYAEMVKYLRIHMSS